MRCGACGSLQPWWEHHHCYACGGSDLAEEELAGGGVLSNYTVVYYPPRDFLGQEPYVVGHITMDEGVLMPAPVVGVAPETVVFAQEPRWVRPDRGRRGGRPRRWVLTGDSPRPVAVGELAARLRLRRVSWREGTKGELSAHFAWVRVWPGADWHRGMRVPPEPTWLLVEEQPGGEVKFALSNLPERTTRLRAVRVWKQRWRVEQGHQQMKEELGLDHFEGRGWRGFHHHAAMVLLAYGFLLLEQARPRAEPVGARKTGAPNRR